METKSRYEVVSELEQQKRALIEEKNGLNTKLKVKEREVTNMQRQITDTTTVMNRKLADLTEDVENFKDSMAEREETIAELIKSVDDSLKRFENLSK